jgi:hypothetical protein
MRFKLNYVIIRQISIYDHEVFVIASEILSFDDLDT